MRRSIGMLAIALAMLVLLGTSVAMGHVSVRVQRGPTIRHNVHVVFQAPPLPKGGYYYAVIVLRPYKMYTQTSPPPCSASSDMQRTDYGYPSPSGKVALALTPAKSSTGHWCPSGRYVGAIYAVPHTPPCKDTYPCRSETYEQPCVGVRPGCVLGVVAEPGKWSYPEDLPAPLAHGTTIVGRFTIGFPRSARGAFARFSTATPVRGPLSKKPKIRPRKRPAPTRLIVRDIIKGAGPKAKAGDLLTVNYVGALYESGKVFDSSWHRHEPFTFPLGRREVIEGWEQDLAGMKVGGRRELVIPPRLAYGRQGSPPTIPPNATLIFVVDLLAA